MSAPLPPSINVNNQNNNNDDNNDDNNDNNTPVQYQFVEVPPAPGDNTTAHMVTQGGSPAKTADQSPPSDPSPSDPSHNIASLLSAASSLEAKAATAPFATADATTTTSVPTCGRTSNEVAAPKLPSISAPNKSNAAAAAATAPAQSIESPAVESVAAPRGQLKDPGNSITSLLSQDNDPSQCDDQDLIIPDPSHALATPFLTASLNSWISILKAEGVEADTDEIVDIKCIYIV
jgi:hypothetical protein